MDSGFGEVFAEKWGAGTRLGQDWDKTGTRLGPMIVFPLASPRG